jgi:hypothetical protein
MHPSESKLALYAGKDLGFWERFRISRHVYRCERCQRHLEELAGVREWIGAQAEEMPVGVNWDNLAAEMRANIRLGIAAGQCVAEPVAPKLSLARWRTPALVSPVLLVMVAGWILLSLHPPIKPASAVYRHDVVLQAGAGGIGLEKDGRGFSLLSPQGEGVIASVRGETAVRSRYVDPDTGQMMVTHVYAQ